MSGSWIDIRERELERREVLREGLTRFGGSGADIPLKGVGDDQLHVWNRPPRAIFVGRGPRPHRNGQPFEEAGLRPGDRIEWAGIVLTYGGEAAAEDLAVLEELAASAPQADRAEAFEWRARVARRVLAGLACELGFADPQAAKHWRQAVLENRFEADECALALLPAHLGPGVEHRLMDRSGTLLRDFLMAPFLSGAPGKRRRLRGATRTLLAFLLAQGLALLTFALIVLAALLVLRVQGFSLDELLDRIVPG